MRILIIGGGIGGLTTAIALGRVGIDAQVYERAAELREVGAGIGLMSNALRVLEVLDLSAAIRSLSCVGAPGRLRNPEGDVLTEIPTDMENQPGAVALVHRAELLDALIHHIDPQRLHLNRNCVAFEQTGDGVTARFQNGETVRADALIGADGLKSAVRARLFGDRPIRYAGYTAWRSVVETDCGHDAISGETWGRGCRFGMFPMSRGRVYWFATNNTREGERDTEGRSKDVLLRLFRGWHKPIEALITAANEGAILRNDIYDLDPLASWSDGRVALLGDAAHPMTPNLGQGAGQAMEDAIVLAACLRKNAGIEAALAEYQSRRIPRVKRFVLHSRWLGAVAQYENALLCTLRNAAVRATPKAKAARQMDSLINVEILTARERELFH